MRRWAQASQRSTWCAGGIRAQRDPGAHPSGPRRRAPRRPHRRSSAKAIADMTLSWPRLTWPAWEARQAGPRWRKMSATSTAGRDNGRASAGHLPQKVEWAGHLADRADGDAGVERRRVEFLMSQRTRAIMRTFYVIETESSVERNSVLANDAALSA